MVVELPQPQDDGAYIAEVGAWSADKHHFLRRYIHAFTTAMTPKAWSSLHYLDLFAGPGILRVEDDGLIWGSPLIAAQTEKRFSQLHLCELGKKEFDALSNRVARISQPKPPQLIHGDCNLTINEIVDQIPADSLSLAFLDPHGLHLDFETLVTLSRRRADLIIFFPDHLDALRNWKIYQGRSNSNLDRTLGTSNWYSKMHAHPQNRWADALREIYLEQISKLGYEHFEDERIAMPNGRFLYKLLFCSRHDRGAAIWRGIAKKKPDGQYGLFG